MPFLDHLEELRWRIIWSLAALMVSVGIAFWVMMQFDVIGLLERPILPFLNGHKLVYTHPGDPFSIVPQRRDRARRGDRTAGHLLPALVVHLSRATQAREEAGHADVPVRDLSLSLRRVPVVVSSSYRWRCPGS